MAVNNNEGKYRRIRSVLSKTVSRMSRPWLRLSVAAQARPRSPGMVVRARAGVKHIAAAARGGRRRKLRASRALCCRQLFRRHGDDQRMIAQSELQRGDARMASDRFRADRRIVDLRRVRIAQTHLDFIGTLQ